MIMDQLIPFYKPNKKVKGDKMIDYLITQTKHANSFSRSTQRNNLRVKKMLLCLFEIHLSCQCSQRCEDPSWSQAPHT